MWLTPVPQARPRNKLRLLRPKNRPMRISPDRMGLYSKPLKHAEHPEDYYRPLYRNKTQGRRQRMSINRIYKPRVRPTRILLQLWLMKPPADRLYRVNRIHKQILLPKLRMRCNNLMPRINKRPAQQTKRLSKQPMNTIHRMPRIWLIKIPD